MLNSGSEKPNKGFINDIIDLSINSVNSANQAQKAYKRSELN
jgi:hypothetical protein